MKLSRHFIQFAVFESTIIFESWSNFMAQYASVHEGTQYTLWSSSTLIIFLSVQSVQLHPSKCVFFFLFVCQSLEEPVVSPATSSHTFACLFLFLFFLCFWAAKDFNDRLLMCDRCANCALHAGHVRFLFVLEDVLLSDDSSMIFILHLWPLHFFGAASKKWQDFPPTHVMNPGAFLLCWSASHGSRGCTVRSMRCMELNGMDPLKDTPSPIRNVSVSESLCRL